MDVHLIDQPRTDPSTALRALAMVAAQHGLTLDPPGMRRSHPFVGDEPPTAHLITIAEEHGLSVRRVRIKAGELGKVRDLLPALVLLGESRVATLKQLQAKDGATLALLENFETGSVQEVLLDEPRLFRMWDGDLLLLKRRWQLTDADRPFNLTWLVGQVLMEGKLFRDVAIAALLLSLLSLAQPLIAMVLIDRVLYNRSLATLEVLSLAMVGIIFFEVVLTVLRKRLTAIATSRVDARINLYVFDKLLNLPLNFFERTSTGTTTSRVAQIWHVREFLVTVIAGTLLDGLTLFVLLPVLAIMNWKLTVFTLVLGLLILLIYYLFLPRLRIYHQRVVDAETAMGSHFVESVFGIKTVKSLSLDGMKRRERDVLVANVTEARREYDFQTLVPQAIVLPFERLIYIGTLLLGSYMAITSDSTESSGSILAVAMIAARVAAPIVQLANLINGYEYAAGAMGTVGSVLNNPAEEGRSGTGLRQPIHGRIEFKDVKFRYSPTANYAINGASFVIPQGTIFGVMGRSGSGKTTITRLLQGLSRDYEGQIKIDGMDLREIDLDHVRTNIGVVPQENFLFRSTVRENIGAARPTLGFENIVRVSQLAGAEEFIERLPNGYATPVEEGATNFSGGQRQRMAIARALLVDPPILVLDEATSALDAESEAIVNANLMKIAKGRTVIIISHRLSSLMMADNILVMERGKVYDIGRHEELVERCDIYKTLWYQQNRHLDPEGKHVHA